MSHKICYYPISFLYLILLTQQTFGFSILPKKNNLHSREQLSVNYGVFEPGNNWHMASNIVNNRKKGMEQSSSKGFHLRIFYEDYNWDSFDFRLGIDLQHITDNYITFQNTMFLLGLSDTLWRYKTQKILAYLLYGHSPTTIITVYDEVLRGKSNKYELGFEYIWMPGNTWSFKIQTAYQYQKLGAFPTTITFDPSYMAIRGPVFSLGINYIF